MEIIGERIWPFELCTIDQSALERLLNVKALQKFLEALQKNVFEQINVRRQRAIETHNKATNIVTPHFVDYDIFVIYKPVKDRHKLSFMWAGPRQSCAVKGPVVCVVRGPVTQKEETVHVPGIQR